MKERTVLITGGTGFVCMNIAEELLNHGSNVVVFARHPLSAQAFQEFSQKKGRFFTFCGDVLNCDSIQEAISKYHVTDIVHGAAITPSKEIEMERPKQILEINCLGLVNALDAMRASCGGRFIYLGSISGYGEACFQNEVLVEGETLGNPHSLYELSKFTGERIVQRYRELFHMDAVVARVGDVFGPWERQTGVRSYMSFPYQLLAAAQKGETAILPKPNAIDWVYGRDISASVRALMDAEKLEYDIYPLCSSYIWPLTQWCERLEARFPNFHWRMAKPGETATMRVNQIEDNAPMQTTRLIEATGYHPRYDLDAAFEDYMAWVQSHPGYVL